MKKKRLTNNVEKRNYLQKKSYNKFTVLHNRLKQKNTGKEIQINIKKLN